MDKENDNPKIREKDAGGHLLFYRGESFQAFRLPYRMINEVTRVKDACG